MSTPNYQLFCGIDWAESHHDWVLIDVDDLRLAGGRIPESLAGLNTLLADLDEHAPGISVPIIIETERGLLVDELTRTRHQVYPVNPRAVKAYRDRGGVSGAKSDKADARLLANIARTDLARHRPMPADSAGMRALGQLARAHQDSVWRTRKLANEARSLLRDYFPAALVAYTPQKLASIEACTVLAAGSTPQLAGALTTAELTVLLEKAGRQRSIARSVTRLQEVFAAEQMRRDPAVETALGHTLRGLLIELTGALRGTAALEESLVLLVGASPRKDLIDSIPGLGYVLAGRILGEMGDDPDRFANAGSLRNYAGTSPITVASGKSSSVRQRRVTNRRLKGAAWQWAFMSLTHDPAIMARYRELRARKKTHGTATLIIANKLMGGLYHCLSTGQAWDPTKLFAPLPSEPGEPRVGTHQEPQAVAAA